MSRLSLIASALILGLLVSCSNGGGTPTPTPPSTATALAYTDPASGTFQLRKSASLSTPTHLVLEVYGPAAPTGSGVSITLTADGNRAAWGNVSPADASTTYVSNGAVFSLGGPPQILKAKVSGNTLLATVSEKGFGTAKALNGPLLRVALDLKPGITPGAVTLSADPTKCQVLQGDGTLAPLALTVGSLSAQ